MKRVSPFDARGYYYHYGAGRSVGNLGGSFSFPLTLSPILWLDTRVGYLFQTTDESTPVTANNDPVGRSNDRSGNAYNCLQSTSGFRPLFQTTGGLLLDGTDDNLGIPNGVVTTLASTNSVSLACWFKGTVFQSALRLQTDATTGGYIILGYNVATPEFAISTDGGVGLGVNIAGVEDGAWHHIVGVWQRNTVNGFQVYVDNAVSAQKNSADVALPTFSSLTFLAGVGAYLGGGAPAELTTGTLDQIMVFPSALTSTQIAALYAATPH